MVCASAFSADIFAVKRAIDGDSLVLEDGRQVRLIGVDTPELYDNPRNCEDANRHHISEKKVEEFAKKAKAFTRRAIQGRSVRLEYDWQRTDKYGRILAYVYRQPDDYFLNAEILREGYGFAYLVFPFKRSEEFRRYTREARKNGRGLWKKT